MTIDRMRFAQFDDLRARLLAHLKGHGISAVFVAGEADLDFEPGEESPRVALVNLSSMGEHEIRACIDRCLREKLPAVALVSAEQVSDLDPSLGIDDFVVTPPDLDELLARVKRALWRRRSSSQAGTIQVGDLVINPDSYEVSLKERRINLTFKEYELLRLLASHPGRVYDREALLSRIWGYDYFGGTRTVDVHIRRLRSKIDDAEHSFIETIWNVGYRFRDLRRSP